MALYHSLTVWLLTWSIFLSTISSSACESDFHPRTTVHDQSPVNIVVEDAIEKHFPLFQRHLFKALNKAQVKITNNGRTVCVQLLNGTVDIPFIVGGPLLDTKYEFAQMHCHWGPDDLGSEHTVEGLRYSMEIHIVFYEKKYGTFDDAQTHKNGICVVCLFGNVSPQSSLELNNFIVDLTQIRELDSSIERNFIDSFSWIDKRVIGNNFFTYHGSMTTPPFPECVIWIVYIRPIEISRQLLVEFRKLHSTEEGKNINENYRPLKPLNGRFIFHSI